MLLTITEDLWDQSRPGSACGCVLAKALRTVFKTASVTYERIRVTDESSEKLFKHNPASLELIKKFDVGSKPDTFPILLEIEE